MGTLLIHGMDYSRMEIVTAKIEIGIPKPGFIRIFDQSDKELTDVERFQFFMDDSTKLYEMSFVHKGEERSITIINLEQCNNISTLSTSFSEPESEKPLEQF